MKKRFFLPLAGGITLGLLIVSGVSCFSCIIYPESSSAQRFPTMGFEFKSYITPECQLVEEALQDVLSATPYEPSRVGFDDIRDWVAANIGYISDEEQWGVEEYWQTPEETLRLGTGDCEDFAVLLCSLLRAYGIDTEQVYVALSVDDDEYGHAFLIEDWYFNGEWRRIESQAPAHVSFWNRWFEPYKTHPDSGLNKYEITAAFNDLYYYDESFPWD